MDPETWTLNFGFGPGIKYYSGYTTGFGPALSLSFEKGMWQLGPGVLTLGAELGFSYFSSSYKYNDFIGYSYSWISLVTAARAAYHYGWKVRGLDTYGGLATGLRFLIFHSTYYNGYATDYSPGAVNFFPGIFAGVSYFFNKSLGINAEVGYNNTYLQVGMIFKLR